CVCVGAALLVVVSGVGSDEASQGVWLAALLAAAVTGFLFWNFPPARIFMG
ncbi:glycosyl transferase, partial [Escherichia coli]|nr:glycosyl transferase [Escherichia coli]